MPEQSNIKVSVIITTYNNHSTLNRALYSVLNSTFKDFEVIVVNDGASDKEYEVIDEFVTNYDYVSYYNKENGGLGSARHFGVVKSKGEYVCFLDADDEYHEDKISEQYNLIKDMPHQKVVVFTQTQEKVENKDVRVKPLLSLENGVSHIDVSDRYIRNKIRPSGASMMVSRSEYLKVCDRHDTIRRNSEFYLHIRFIANDFSYYIISKPLYHQHKHEESNSKLLTYRLDSIDKILCTSEKVVNADSSNKTKDYINAKLNNIGFTSLTWKREDRVSLYKVVSKYGFVRKSFVYLLISLLPNSLSKSLFKWIRSMV